VPYSDSVSAEAHRKLTFHSSFGMEMYPLYCYTQTASTNKSGDPDWEFRIDKNEQICILSRVWLTILL
jgi:hypothetical protein